MYVQLFGLEIWKFVTREKKTYCLFCTNHNMSYLETQKIMSGQTHKPHIWFSKFYEFFMGNCVLQ